MRLHVIASGSTGNAYLLDFGGDQLLLECGVRWPLLREALGSDLTYLRAAFVSHEHADHSKAAADLLWRGIPCIMSEGTREALELPPSPRLITPSHNRQFSFSNFDILQFPTEHDATDPCGWLIQYRPTGETLLFATDTYYLRIQPRGVHYCMIECNFIAETLERNILAGRVPEEMRHRLLHSHFSLENVLGFFDAADLSKTRGIVLLHMSGNNADEARMVDAVRKATNVETWAARAGLKIDMALTPF